VKRPARSTALALLLAAPVTALRIAEAAPAEDPRVAEARRACAAGHVDRGVDLLASIIADTGDPSAVYNQARCYQQNGRSEEAINRFREYLRIGSKEPPSDRRTAERFIQELEAEIKEKEKRAPVVTPVAPPAPDTLPPSSVVIEPAPPASLTSEPASAPTPTLRWASYGAGAVGVLGLGFGIFNSLQVRSIEKQLNDIPQIQSKEWNERYAEGERAQSRQWIGYGLGAASLVSAGILFWLSRPEGGPQISFTLPAGPGGGAGLSLSGRY
jgi:hypothetical protein